MNRTINKGFQKWGILKTKERIDDESIAGKGKFVYLIAGKYAGGEVPEGMMLYEFPQGEWAVFDCIGAIPDALQSLNTQIFKEWLPGNLDTCEKKVNLTSSGPAE